METEQQLLEAIHNGERAAMRRLYDRYSGYTMAIVLRYIPEHEEVRDVLQDSFVKILMGIAKFNYRGEGSLKNWVSRVVVNEAIDHLRERQSVTFADTIPDMTDEELPDMEDIPPEVLTEMIGRLPANYRMVLNLFVFEQRSHREIAQLLGVKEVSSASIFLRAKRKLGKMIKDYQNKHKT